MPLTNGNGNHAPSVCPFIVDGHILGSNTVEVTISYVAGINWTIVPMKVLQLVGKLIYTS